jgi:energy-coupling factor transport system substrate-specific component
VSWPLASFAIVLGILLAGWLAYERSRPSARMAAVVATLAAVAALGRDAFVALPDVKPITAMTLVVGYALGPLAGFVVGAVGMLASNILLGQGPYTPWQMVAWGLVGVAGAALGRLSGRRMGRLTLALACALTAMAAKEIMNLYTWTIGASHTPAALLAIAAGALPFDVTDAVASFLFGLAFAPELARLLGRLRARMDVEWQPIHITAALLVPVVCLIAAASPARASLSSEIAYLTRAQNRDGGFGGAPGQRSSELYSAWAAIGLAAAGRDPLGLARGGHTVLDSLRAQAATLEGAGDVERTILALRACGLPIGSFPGNLIGRLLSARARDGSFGQLVNITTFAIFALRAAGRPPGDPVVRAAGHWLAAQQSGDGGFGFAGRGGSEDVDDTAAALQGLIDAGFRHTPAVARAVAFLRRAQNPDGGYPQQPGGESNAQSTAWAVQGLTAAGLNAAAVKRAGSRSPPAYLQSLVAPDGSVRYSRTSAQTPVWVTAQALTALAGKPFPVAPVSGSSRRGPARAGSSTGGAVAPSASTSRSRPGGASPSPPHSRRTGLPPGLVAAIGASGLTTVARTVGELIDALLVPRGW